MTPKEKLVMKIGIPILCAFVLYSTYTFIQSQRLDKLLRKEAKINLKEEGGRSGKDIWGERIIYTYVGSDDVLISTATSVGRDGEMNTKDDVTRTAHDFNKSKIIGEWVGKKSFQVIKGFNEGFKDTDKDDVK